MIISSVHKKSPAARLGLQPGDDLLRIDGRKIHDPIDFQFYSAEEGCRLVLRRDGREFEVIVEGEEGGWLGIEFAEMEYKCCGNQCVFCFVDQNPQGMRSSLYFKDEDYRLSFLYGNYVTLTNLARSDLARIVEQRLSPLYISVHSTEDEVRRRMLGLRGDDRLMQKIAFLAEGGIELHTQIVLCPGWNDGVHLERTIADLAGFFPAVQSVAVVPLGLTGHREKLPALRPVHPTEAKQLIEQERGWEKSYRDALGCAFVYLADEFYLLAGAALPPAERYDEFPQIENGVGMTRYFMDRFKRQKRRFPKEVKPVQGVIVTGQLAAPVLAEEVVPALQKIAGLQVKVAPVVNRFFGGGVTVSGLLTGQDIIAQLREKMPADFIMLPPNCRNGDGLFLDDLEIGDLVRELETPVFAPEENFGEMFTFIERL
jgi:putative radical SAM enzyme (TIGR03279 family)